MQVQTQLDPTVAFTEAASMLGLYLADFNVHHHPEAKSPNHRYRSTFKLRVQPGNRNYLSRNPHTERAIGSHIPCWHGTRDFLMQVFKWDSNARVVSGWGFTVVYNGSDDFDEKFEETQYTELGSTYFPYQYIDKCAHEYAVRSWS